MDFSLMQADAGQQARLLAHMPSVQSNCRELKDLNKQWVRTTLTGKINSSRVASTLIEFMESTQGKFMTLQEKLVAALVWETLKKTVLEMAGMSQVAIDILKRNLYERTADVGFLATDEDIRRFLADPDATPEDEARLTARLEAYRANYTVYDEIVVLDLDGRVRAHLDQNSPIAISRDPLLQETLARDGYLETFRATDLRPGQGESLVYSHRILDGETGRPLGVLCLCFDFQGEMRGVFDKLLQGRDSTICIVDDHCKVIATSNPAVAAMDTDCETVLDEEFKILRQNGVEHLAKTARTNGYQGFLGLPWHGHVLQPLGRAFQGDADVAGLSEELVRSTNLFAGLLLEIDDDAENVLADLELVVLNGEVMAAKQLVNDDARVKQEANALPPVLGAIRRIGEAIRGLFAASIANLLRTVLSSRLEDARFLASLAIDIMDRNLYERANDCRWWALTSLFRETLARQAQSGGPVSAEDAGRMREVLAYINSLYTVYSNLVVHDAQGVVAAVSNPAWAHLEGARLGDESFAEALRLRSPRDYRVSRFSPTPLYAGEDGAPRHTYIYHAAIMHPDDEGQVVGGIGIVFDSEPQFRDMLRDALPRDATGGVLPGSAGLFLDREGRVISSTSDAWKPGDLFPAAGDLSGLASGQGLSRIITLEGKRHILGAVMSEGYREYKRDGGYVNDVAGVVLVAL